MARAADSQDERDHALEQARRSGDIGACPEVLSSEALPLDAAEIAPWVALAAGHHEQTLFWRREALSDAVRGFEEHTTVSIDVSVLGARERLYGDGGYEGDEFESCRDRRSRQLDLDIRIATADGAVATSFLPPPRSRSAWASRATLASAATSPSSTRR